MLILTLLDGRTPLQEWKFRNPERVRIGRADDNDIVLDYSQEVSRYHAELVPHGDQWRLLSYGANGTFLNGQSVRESLVTNGALMQFARGGPRIQFQQTRTTAPLTPCTHPNNPPTALFCIHCGQTLYQPQQIIRHYQVLKTLGQGGMGTTYLARDVIQNQLVVLKAMNADMAQLAKAQELFAREVRILQGLNHSGIPRYYDSFSEAGKTYLVMELVHGVNLEQWVRQWGVVSLPEVVGWMVQLCEILAYLHGLTPPLVHRDVKPANVMVRNRDRTLVLLDFGAVKEVGTPYGTRIGAEGYTAPEQDRGQPCPQSDLFAIGPTLTYLLTGNSPVQYYRFDHHIPRFSVASVPGLSDELRQVIERVTAPKVSDRYPDAIALAAALQACVPPPVAQV
ncbi:FHA domain-containing serine/threonine-protein kinase [Spirulina major]|uniref:FHA domain-containing serine/threonine-protein kinase n=1 Tax=Spirulina major TaxID=270636 RepID=UPI000934F58D|nr:FHA domain-containing serine/threonine-protein kinase [Spirulina major]